MTNPAFTLIQWTLSLIPNCTLPLNLVVDNARRLFASVVHAGAIIVIVLMNVQEKAIFNASVAVSENITKLKLGERVI
jgi:hypothetical protein